MLLSLGRGCGGRTQREDVEYTVMSHAIAGACFGATYTLYLLSVDGRMNPQAHVREIILMVEFQAKLTDSVKMSRIKMVEFSSRSHPETQAGGSSTSLFG